MSAFEELVNNSGYLVLHKTGNKVVTLGVPEWSQGTILKDSRSQNNGTYLNWKWDGDVLSVTNDRYGMYPLFYCELTDGIVIATTFTKTLEYCQDKALDFDALSVFMRIGHLIGNDTPVKSIRVLPPNTTLSWNKDKGLHLYSTPIKNCFSGELTLSYDEAIEAYSHYFSLSISRRLPDSDNFTVPISGGRDSRHILFELVKQGAKPASSMTLQYRPPATNDDTRIAKLICERLSIEHTVVQRPDNWFDVVLNEIYLSNFAGGGHSWMLPMARFIGEQGYSTSYDGLAGGIVTAGQTMDGTALQLLRDGQLENFAHRIFKSNGLENFNQYALTSDFSKEVSYERAVNRLIKELKQYENFGSPLMAYTFWNRTRRAISSIPFSILSRVDNVHCPYLDNDFFDFCTSLNPEFCINRPFHDDIINRAYPEWADIPYQNKSLVAPINSDCRQYYRRSVNDLIRYLWQRRKTQSTLISEKYIRKRVAKSLFTGNQEQPWYMRPAVYMYELERLINNSGC